eukprot:6492571-Amphidinium_carterae.1
MPVTTVPREDWPTYFGSGGLRSHGLFDFSALWEYDLESVITHDIFSLSSVTEISVHMESCCIDGFQVGSYSEALPLQTVLSALEFDHVAEKKIGPQGKKKDAGRHLGAGSLSVSQKPTLSGSAGAALSSDSSESEDEHKDTETHNVDELALSEEQWSTVYEEVKDAKTAWSLPADSVDEHFYSSVEGGQWSVQRSNRAVQGLRSHVVKAGELDKFCSLFHLQKSASFAYSVFTAVQADCVMRTWQHRLIYLFKHWNESARPDQWTAVELSAFTLPPEFELSQESVSAAVWKPGEVVGWNKSHANEPSTCKRESHLVQLWVPLVRSVSVSASCAWLWEEHALSDAVALQWPK